MLYVAPEPPDFQVLPEKRMWIMARTISIGQQDFETVRNVAAGKQIAGKSISVAQDEMNVKEGRRWNIISKKLR